MIKNLKIGAVHLHSQTYVNFTIHYAHHLYVVEVTGLEVNTSKKCKNKVLC